MNMITPWEQSPVPVDFITNASGVIGRQVDGEFIEGVCVEWGNWLTDVAELPYDVPILVTLSVPGDELKVKPVNFSFELKRFAFDESMAAGAYVSVLGGMKFLGKIMGVAGTLGGGAGLELGIKGYNDSEVHDERFVVKGSHDRISTGFGTKFDLTRLAKTAKARAYLGDDQKNDSLVNANIGVKINYSYTTGAEYNFELNHLMLADRDALLAGLALLYMQVANGKADPALAHIFEKLNPLISQISTETKVATFADHTLTMTAEGEVGLNLGKSDDEKARGLQIKPAAGLQGDLNIGFVWSDEVHSFEGKTIDSFTVSGELNGQAGLNIGLSNVTELNPVKNTTLQQEIDKLIGFGVSTHVGTSIRQALIHDPNLNGLPVKLEVTVMCDKKFGYGLTPAGLENLGEGQQMGITYTVDTLESIRSVLQSISEFAALLGDARKLAMGIADEADLMTIIEIGPTKAHEKLVEFIHVLLGQDGVTYEIQKKTGRGQEFSITPVKDLLGAIYENAPAEIDLPIKLKIDQSSSQTVEKGTFANGKQYLLEAYSASNIQAPPIGRVDIVLNQIQQRLTQMLVNTFREIIRDPGSLIIRTIGSSELQLAAADDFDAVVGPLAFDFEAISGPLIPAYYAPWDATGPAGKPHYGIGGFHMFFPTDYTLTQPAALILDYHDAEVAGLDEATLAIYRWNEETDDWEMVGGIQDTESNTVRAEISQLGLYTLAPAMPAGDLDWEDPVVVPEAGNMRVTLASGEILTNSGEVVPDGTIFHVTSQLPCAIADGQSVPFGTITSNDVQPDVDGIQVAVENGILQVEVLYPAEISPQARILVYSDRGTAFGICDVSLE
jgi:hypothetical protein